MKVVTAAQMRAVEDITINKYNIPGMVLMETAGIGVVRAMTGKFGNIADKSILVFCGKGNNGGDGFVIARHLKRIGCKIKLVLLGNIDRLKGDAKTNATIYTGCGGKVYESTSGEPVDNLESWINHSHLVVDAILGTGLNSAITGEPARIIKLINKLAPVVVSVDIPSGLSADTGKTLGCAIKAELTVTIGLPKLAFFLPGGSSLYGSLMVADIFIPEDAVNSLNIKTEIFQKPTIEPLKKDSYKHSLGHLLIVAGSKGMAGASAMASLAALRCGCGILSAALPKSINDIIQSALPEAITIPLEESEEGSFNESAAKVLLAQKERFDAAAIGPGISRNKSTKIFLEKIVKNITSPLLIDADGITLLNKDWLTSRTNTTVLTPHSGEMATLTGTSSKYVEENRMKIAGEFAVKHSVFIILKGAHTIIATPEGKIFFNRKGNPGMATAGSGDVLTGITSALLGRKMKTEDALKLAVWIHSTAGDIAAKDKGEHSLIASDIINNIHPAMQAIEPDFSFNRDLLLTL